MIKITISKYPEPEPKKTGFLSFFNRTEECRKLSKEELLRQQKVNDRNSLITIGGIFILAAVTIITDSIVGAKKK